MRLFKQRPMIDFYAALLVAITLATPLRGQSSGDGVAFFETNIRPTLVTHCYECHSEAAGKSRGGLKVDSADAIRRGGESGPAVIPRDADKSLLLRAMRHSEGVSQMPPTGRLPESVLEDFRKWITMGAPDPRVAPIASTVTTKMDLKGGRDFWAYRTVTAPRVPPADPWSRTEIDRFVASQRSRDGLSPVEDADARTLIRRLYLVLVGLPPNPEEMSHWLGRIASDRSAPYSTGIDQSEVNELIDHLLDQSQFGEHWGRHWMDVVRFAESTGGDHNNTFLHAWRYRDWIMDAFNADMPYDIFVRAQLAGDLLPIANDREWANNVIATGFLAIGVKLVGEEDQQQYFADLVDEQIDATTRVFLGTSVACARCHDHKFDPIPQTDYYALASIFRATQTHYGLLKAQARQATTLIDLTDLGLDEKPHRLDREAHATLLRERDEARQAVDDAMKKIRSGENVFRGTLRRLRSKRDETEAALQAYLPDGRQRVFAMGAQDRDYPLTTRLLVRGELDKPAQVIEPGFLHVLSEPSRESLSSWANTLAVKREKTAMELGPPGYRSTSGRLELAQWISSRRNPLTARVMVNRIWHWMFGRGLVRTVDDFGSAGETPSHAELLDHLAVQFMDAGWSIKTLVREIARSRTWQLASSYDETAFTVDPDNKRLWRMNRRRLEAESVRDAMLCTSGMLQSARPNGTLLREAGEGNVGQNVFEPVIRALDWNHRSVYLPRVRGVLPEMLEVFDAPDAGLVSGARDSTSSPIQALYLLNSDWMHRQSVAFSKRVQDAPPNQRIHRAYQLAFAREPRPQEIQAAVTFMEDVSGTSMSADEKLVAYCHALLCTAEFRTID
ncbi:MAG: PSD1 and planctomycete cytochrome C domain-containing protein [Planctomycetota bacterium]